MPSSVDLALLPDDRERLVAIERAWKAYHGQAPPPLAPRLGHDDNVVLSPRTVVDATVDFLFGRSAPTITCADESVQEQLDYLWLGEGREHDQLTVLTNLGIYGAVTGQAIGKIVPGATRPKLVALNPAQVLVETRGDDVDAVERIEIHWEEKRGEGARRVKVHVRQLITPQGGSSWLLEDQLSQGGLWKTERSEVWPYPWPPVAWAQNLPEPGSFWGAPDLSSDILDLNERLSSILSMMNRILRFHAQPVPWIAGMDEQGIAEIKHEIGDLLTLPSPGAKVGLLEFSAAALPSMMDTYARVKQQLHEQSRTPQVAVGELENIGQLASGLALALAYGPLVAKTETKRRLYAPLLQELSARSLATMGVSGEVEIVLQWPELLPTSIVEETQALEADLRMGIVSKQTVAEQRGYDWERESERMAEEKTSVANTALRQFDAGFGGFGSPMDENGEVPVAPTP